jgi:hypothetical protein
MRAVPSHRPSGHLSPSLLSRESRPSQPTRERGSIGRAGGREANHLLKSIALATLHSLVLLAVALAHILGVLQAAFVAAGTWVARAT